MPRLLHWIFGPRCRGCGSQRGLRFFPRGGWFMELPAVRFFFRDVALCLDCERRSIALESASQFRASAYPAPFVGPGRRVA